MEKQSVLVDGYPESEVVLEDAEAEGCKDNDEPYDLDDRLYEEWRDRRDMREGERKGRVEKVGANLG